MTGHFDERAATWDDDPAKVERGQRVAAAIADAVPLDHETRVLEYGAGTGLVAQFLADRTGPITLAEPSPAMRGVATDKATAGVLPANTRIWDLDLAAAPPPDEQFDLIATSMVLHHIVDLDPVLRGFATLLAPGGHVAIVDLDEDDGSFHSHHPDFEGHDGFDHDELRDRLEAAGFTQIAFRPCGEVVKDDRRYSLFLATATRDL